MADMALNNALIIVSIMSVGYRDWDYRWCVW